jgi:hypothetical protein
MKFDFEHILNFLPLVPVVVAGIEHIHSDADSATKKQLAQESLALAAGVAGAILPGEAPLIDVSSAGVSLMIDAVVKIFNETGVFFHKPQPAAVAK